MTPTLLNNRYRVLQVVGSGGFGETFLAEDTQMPSGRRCVIKQLKPVANNSQVYQLVQQRFQQEAAILEELGDRSNQIPRLYAYFFENGQFYLVQEYIEGQTLSQKLQQQGLLNETAVQEILINILPVLDFVHSKRMVHRDIKPDNIILRFADGKPVLIDFGAVKVTMQTEIATSGNSNPSIVIGTPGFMPTEQSVGRPVFSSDLYSLGLTAIYLLTGRIPQQLPFDTMTGEIIWRQFAFNINPNFAEVLDKAVRKSPRDRYMNAKEMLAALQTAINPIPPTLPPSQPTVITAPPPPSAPATQPVASAYQQQYQQQAVSPQTPQIITRKNGLAPWQQGVIIGGAIGVCVVGGLWLIRGQTPTQPESTTTVLESSTSPISSSPISSQKEEKPTQIQSNTSSTTTSSNRNPKPIRIKPTSSNTPISQPSQTPDIPSTPNPETSSPPTSTITQKEAKEVINKWLQAKRVMFAPPYNVQPAAELTTGEQYEQVAGTDGSINSLKNDGQYYKYGVQTIDSVDEFSVNDNQAIIQVKVTEDRTLFNQDGSIVPKETDFKTRTVRYSLQFVDKRWKIASTQIMSN
ncbi:MAG: IMS domain-containing protein [Heteroscytonema crispum UTEX LB 1556]